MRGIIMTRLVLFNVGIREPGSADRGDVVASFPFVRPLT